MSAIPVVLEKALASLKNAEVLNFLSQVDEKSLTIPGASSDKYRAFLLAFAALKKQQRAALYDQGTAIAVTRGILVNDDALVVVEEKKAPAKKQSALEKRLAALEALLPEKKEEAESEGEEPEEEEEEEPEEEEEEDEEVPARVVRAKNRCAFVPLTGINANKRCTNRCVGQYCGQHNSAIKKRVGPQCAKKAPAKKGGKKQCTFVPSTGKFANKRCKNMGDGPLCSRHAYYVANRETAPKKKKKSACSGGSCK